MHRRVLKAVETKAEKVRMAKGKRGGTERRSRKEAEGGWEKKEDKGEQEKERENNRAKENSRKVRDMEWGRDSSKVRERCKKIGPRMISQMN